LPPRNDFLDGAAIGQIQHFRNESVDRFLQPRIIIGVEVVQSDNPLTRPKQPLRDVKPIKPAASATDTADLDPAPSSPGDS
jgi:hypothetical protein